jgi:plasmid stabilization system protein ParE
VSSLPAVWSVRFTSAAERDLRDISEWTHRKFGPLQDRTYAAAIEAAVAALESGPKLAGVRHSGDIAAGLFSLRIKIKRRKGRHLLYFRVAVATHDIIIVRVLHDAMDPGRHIPEAD